MVLEGGDSGGMRRWYWREEGVVVEGGGSGGRRRW